MDWIKSNQIPGQSLQTPAVVRLFQMINAIIFRGNGNEPKANLKFVDDLP